MQVRLSTDKFRAGYKETLPVDSPDEELGAVAVQLQQDVVISHDTFGEVKLEEERVLFNSLLENLHASRLGFSTRILTSSLNIFHCFDFVQFDESFISLCCLAVNQSIALRSLPTS